MSLPASFFFKIASIVLLMKFLLAFDFFEHSKPGYFIAGAPLRNHLNPRPKLEAPWIVKVNVSLHRDHLLTVSGRLESQLRVRSSRSPP